MKAGGTIAKTEAGDGMFGKDIELDSLTDSEEHFDEDMDKEFDDVNLERDFKVKGDSKPEPKFKIVSGEDSDSMFEERMQHDAKFEDMDLDDYDDE